MIKIAADDSLTINYSINIDSKSSYRIFCSNNIHDANMEYKK